MKTIIYLATVCLGIGLEQVQGQACTSMPFFTQGKEIDFISNLRREATERYVVQTVNQDGGKIVASYQLMADATGGSKKKSGVSAITTATCDASGVSISINVQDKNDNYTFTQQYPSNMKIGDTLAGYTIVTDKGRMTMKALRKVSGQEQVYTSAGNWMCFKIEVLYTIVTAHGPQYYNGPLPPAFEWYSPAVGLIKSQSLFFTQVMSAIK